MKIFNVDNLVQFKNLNLKTEEEIINFFKDYDEKFYINNNIYFERHHIKPRSECNIENNDLILLPIKYHFLIHYYRAFSWKEKGNISNYKKNIGAATIISHIKVIDNNINFDQIYKIKEKSFYQFNKKVICLNTLQIYESITDASIKTKNLKGYIRKCCQNNGKFRKYNYNPNYYYWSFYESINDLDFYKDLYQQCLNKKIKKQKWSDEAIKSRADKVRGTHYITKRSYKIKNLKTNEIYSCLTDALIKTKIPKKRFYKLLKLEEEFKKL
jgi:hypothetical protein